MHQMGVPTRRKSVMKIANFDKRLSSIHPSTGFMVMTANSEQSRQPHTPLCETCRFVLPSETSQTQFRCGLSYFRSSAIMRKFVLMQHFPEVKPSNACESWEQGMMQDPQDEPLFKKFQLNPSRN